MTSRFWAAANCLNVHLVVFFVYDKTNVKNFQSYHSLISCGHHNKETLQHQMELVFVQQLCLNTIKFKFVEGYGKEYISYIHEDND